MNGVVKEREGKASENKRASALIRPRPSPTAVEKPATNQNGALYEDSELPVPAPKTVRRLPIAQERDQGWVAALRKINRLVAAAYLIAVSRLERTDLTDAERLCLARVRAIITYGEAQHRGVDKHVLDKIVQGCLELEDQHKQEVRSGKPLWWLTTSDTKTNPRGGFKDVLREYRNIRQDACKTFNQWANMVDRAVRAARRARTLE